MLFSSTFNILLLSYQIFKKCYLKLLLQITSLRLLLFWITVLIERKGESNSEEETEEAWKNSKVSVNNIENLLQ